MKQRTKESFFSLSLAIDRLWLRACNMNSKSQLSCYWYLLLDALMMFRFTSSQCFFRSCLRTRTLSTSVITFIAPGTTLNHEIAILPFLCAEQIVVFAVWWNSTPVEKKSNEEIGPDLDEKDGFQCSRLFQPIIFYFSLNLSLNI